MCRRVRQLFHEFCSVQCVIYSSYIYKYMHISIISKCQNVHINIDFYINRINTYEYQYLRTCIHVHIISISISIYICTYISIYQSIYIYIYIYTYIYIYICIYICIYIYIYHTAKKIWKIMTQIHVKNHKYAY